MDNSFDVEKIEKSFDVAKKDIVDLIEKWAEEKLEVESCVYAVLPIMIKALFFTSPTAASAHAMLATCFQASYDEDDDLSN